MIFQTIIIWSKIIHSLKNLRSPTLNCKDIGIRKSEFVTKTQFLFLRDSKIFLGDPQIFFGDPQLFIGDLKLFIGEASVSSEAPWYLLKTQYYYRFSLGFQWKSVVSDGKLSPMKICGSLMRWSWGFVIYLWLQC